jgi:DNA repair exonuclease SbcCD ATPase subunit
MSAEKQIQSLEQINKLNKEKIICEKYLECINNSFGIPFQILRASCYAIEASVNNMLSHISDFSIKFKFDSKKFRLQLDEGDRKMTASMGSSFQKFVIDLSMRLALLSNHPFLPGFIIIDEGFGSMDPEHLFNMKEFINNFNISNSIQRSFCSWMIIISHIEDLHYTSTSQLRIRTDQKSQMTFGIEPQVPKNNMIVIESPLPTLIEGKSLYCSICDRHLLNRSNAMAKHIHTKGHVNMTLRRKNIEMKVI